jgi:hypothetical protein
VIQRLFQCDSSGFERALDSLIPIDGGRFEVTITENGLALQLLGEPWDGHARRPLQDDQMARRREFAEAGVEFFERALDKFDPPV